MKVTVLDARTNRAVDGAWLRWPFEMLTVKGGNLEEVYPNNEKTGKDGQVFFWPTAHPSHPPTEKKNCTLVGEEQVTIQMPGAGLDRGGAGLRGQRRRDRGEDLLRAEEERGTVATLISDN